MDAELQQRVADLEMRHAFLDDMVHQLDGVIAVQQRVIERLREELQQLSATVKQGLPATSATDDEPPPPHY